ncbi:MAG TPA: hypothetical protein VJL54_07265 [Nitrososphaera sp.]|nr:hypothetical protein [Nitrososphaera sp.]
MNKPAAWFEISVSTDTEPHSVIEESMLRQNPVLAEILAAAQVASSGKGRAGMWEYSRKLSEQELRDVKESMVFSSTFEDERCKVQSVRLSHNNIYYSVRLFEEKHHAPSEGDE